MSHTRPNDVLLHSDTSSAQGQPQKNLSRAPKNGRAARARSRRLSRVLGTKNRELSDLKEQLNVLADENRDLRGMIQAEPVELEALKQSNSELRKTLRIRELFHTAKLAQECERYSDREGTLQRLLSDQAKGYEEVSRRYEALRNGGCATMCQVWLSLNMQRSVLLLMFPMTRRLQVRQQEAKLSELISQMRDVREDLTRAEHAVAVHAASESQQAEIIHAKDTVIAALQEELSNVKEQYPTLLRDPSSNHTYVNHGETEFQSILEETSRGLELTRDHIQTVFQEYKSVLVDLHAAARRAEEALGNQAVGYEVRLMESQREVRVLTELTERMHGDCQDLTKSWFEKLRCLRS
ncbi:hypothetical protein V5O48_013090 [Marasmius crinis-equi]|uniref:Uncharacterized protein n=1 Tax=Marasmius crinis-equi TaxID=585013 RepID=A0ABR3ET70_9AGAR